MALPPRLDALLAHLLRVSTIPVFIGGFATACSDRNHAFALWKVGWYGARNLQLSICPACETVEVRDISLDSVLGLPTGPGALRRRDELLGWYAGTRRDRRVHL